MQAALHVTTRLSVPLIEKSYFPEMKIGKASKINRVQSFPEFTEAAEDTRNIN